MRRERRRSRERAEHYSERSHRRRSSPRSRENRDRRDDERGPPMRTNQPKISSIKDSLARSKECPFVLRTFFSFGKRNKPSDYTLEKFPENEKFIHTWRNVTIRELTFLVMELYPECRKFGTHIEYSIVHPNFNTKTYDMKHFGNSSIGMNKANDNFSLKDTKFQVGDCLDISAFPYRTKNRVQKNVEVPAQD